jgi:hypothetical protein
MECAFALCSQTQFDCTTRQRFLQTPEEQPAERTGSWPQSRFLEAIQVDQTESNHIPVFFDRRSRGCQLGAVASDSPTASVIGARGAAHPAVKLNLATR